MDYMFNIDIAVKYGVEEAVFIHNLYFWIKKNKANNEHFHDGRYWTYNSRKALSELFPFWTEKQIRRITENLIGKEIIYTGNYNKTKRDRTSWYALSDDIISMYETGKCKCPNGQMELPKQANANAQTGSPLPDSNTDINTDNIPPYNPPASGGSETVDSENEKGVEIIDGDKAFEELCEIYPRANGNEKAKSLYMGFLTNGRKFDGYPVTRLNHWQIYAAVKKFVMDMDNENRETDKMPYFSTLFNADMLGYVKKSQVGYEKAMLKKYGEYWHKIKFKYTFAYPKAARKRRKDKNNE